MALFSENNSCDVQTNEEGMDFESWDDEDSLSLKINLLRGIYSYGFEKPSNIQYKSIPLIKKGVDINSRSKEQTTPLHLAAYYGKEKIVDTLIENGAILDFIGAPVHPGCRKDQ